MNVTLAVFFLLLLSAKRFIRSIRLLSNSCIFMIMSNMPKGPHWK